MDISNSLLNWYKKLKQTLEDSNIALTNRGLNIVDNLYKIPNEIEKLGEINHLPYLIRKELLEVTEKEMGNITSISDRAFFYCDTLQNVTIPDSVITIGNYAFSDCSSLESITIPGNVTTIGDSAFYNCDSLQSVTISDGVTHIGDSAFEHCDNLQSVTIPDSVTTIGDSAFRACYYSLSSITIPNSVISIGSFAFRLSLLNGHIYINSTTPPSLGNTDAIYTTTRIHVPIGSGDAYRNATNWSYHSARIVEDIQL